MTLELDCMQQFLLLYRISLLISLPSRHCMASYIAIKVCFFLSILNRNKEIKVSEVFLIEIYVYIEESIVYIAI